MSDPNSIHDVEDGPASPKSRPDTIPDQVDEGPKTLQQQIVECANEVHATLQRLGFTIESYVVQRQVARGGLLIDSGWRFVPVQQGHAHP